VTRILAIVCALALGACESVSTDLGPRPDIKAVRVQNQETIKQTQSFQESNQRTRAHIKRIQDEAVQEESALETAKKYLDELLNDDD
jgi:hypothetical protein